MERPRERARVSRVARAETPRTLEAVMREPNATPDVVVVDSIDEVIPKKEVADPKKDLWLSTADG